MRWRARVMRSSHVYGDPRASCFHARHALERLVKRVYRVEKTLDPPKVTNLDAYLSEPAFRALAPEVVWQKAEYIRQAGNVAVHGNKTPDAGARVERRTGAGARPLLGGSHLSAERERRAFTGRPSTSPWSQQLEPGAAPASVEELDALKRDAGRGRGRPQGGIEGELEALRERLAAIKAENESVPETRDWNESATRRLIIDLALQRAGWPLDQEHDREYEGHGHAERLGGRLRRLRPVGR